MDNISLRKLCSDVTLQSQKEGFFNQWVDQVDNLLTNEFFFQFCQLKSDKERFKLTWEQECVHTLQILECFTPKNLKVSEEKRKEGNKAFQSNDDSKALLFYTQAVIRAPSEGEAISLCFANRSAALFHCKHYKHCLQDIDLALSHGYPNRLKYKILERRGQCLAKFGRVKESECAFQEAISAVQESDLTDGKRETWIQETLKKMSQVKVDQESLEKDNCTEDDVYKEKLYKSESKIFPRASSSLTLKYTEETGRFMAASEDIPAVKILVRELPFSSVLMQEKRGMFCENCFKKIIAPISCIDCSGVAFCSSECQSIGLKSYHKWECRYLNLFKASGMSLNCFLALRVLTERGFNFFKELSLEDLKSTEMPSKKSPHFPDDFKNFYNLVGLEEQRSPQDFLRRTLMAVFLLKVLQHSGFFENKITGEDITQDELLIGTILLRNLQVIQFNAHEVSGISYEGRRSYSLCKSVYLGLAVYPTVSFFNHSCYPAVGRYFNGKEMAVVNLRPLKKGEMVAENYGPIFTHSNRDQRQKKLLSRYWFTCRCEACEGDWSMYNNMPNIITFIEPAEIKGENQKEKTKNKNKKKSKNLKQNNDVKSENSKENPTEYDDVAKDDISTNIQKYFDVGKSLMDEFKREEAIEEYKKYVEAVVHRVKLPLKDLHLSLECLRLLVGSRGTSYVINK